MKFRMLILLLIIAVIPVKSDTNETKTIDVLMEMLQVYPLQEHYITSSLKMIENSIPNLPKEVLDLCRKEILKWDYPGKMAEIYSKYFTEDEMKDLIAFYRTPTGQKALVTIPIIQNELKTQTESFKTEIINTCSEILLERGYIEKE